MADRAEDRTMEDRTDHERERGATLVEYALILALVVGATALAVTNLTDTSGQYLSSTGQDIGQPRDRIVNMDNDLPDPPAWLP